MTVYRIGCNLGVTRVLREVVLDNLRFYGWIAFILEASTEDVSTVLLLSTWLLTAFQSLPLLQGNICVLLRLTYLLIYLLTYLLKNAA